MYARSVKGKTLNFTVSGKLWRRSLVMRDPETGTLWSHLLGKAMKGELAGAQLETLPSVMTDWATWKERNPDTTVLNMKRTARDFVRDIHREAGRFVFGVRTLSAAKAFPYDVLARQPVITDTVGGEAFVITFDVGTATARVFSAKLDGRRLGFTAAGDGRMKDAETKSIWDTVSGECVSGALKGKKLPPEIGIPSFRKAWETFYPDGAVYRGS